MRFIFVALVTLVISFTSRSRPRSHPPSNSIVFLSSRLRKTCRNGKGRDDLRYLAEELGISGMYRHIKGQGEDWIQGAVAGRYEGNPHRIRDAVHLASGKRPVHLWASLASFQRRKEAKDVKMSRLCKVGYLVSERHNMSFKAVSRSFQRSSLYCSFHLSGLLSNIFGIFEQFYFTKIIDSSSKKIPTSHPISVCNSPQLQPPPGRILSSPETTATWPTRDFAQSGRHLPYHPHPKSLALPPERSPNGDFRTPRW